MTSKDINVLSEEDLEKLIELLRRAQQMGFASSGISAIDVALEAFIDSALIVANTIDNGGNFQIPNPELKDEGIDELSNPKLVFRYQHPKRLQDPNIAEMFRTMATLGVRLKRYNTDQTYAEMQRDVQSWPRLVRKALFMREFNMKHNLHPEEYAKQLSPQQQRAAEKAFRQSEAKRAKMWYVARQRKNRRSRRTRE